jgi:hypothetical protein
MVTDELLGTLVTDSADHPTDCFHCKLKTIQVSPKATPNRRRKNQTEKKDGNSWEKGIVRDGRGMPHLNPGTLEPMPIKTYVENRHKIEEAKREMLRPQEE